MKQMLLILILFSPNAWSYPELSRHGYVNCTTCHLSPSGGGILTPYGRELSKEVLSTWAKEGEQNFAFGTISTDERVLLSGYFRGLQVFREDKRRKSARFIFMQADLEAGFNAEKWALVASIGRQEIRSNNESNGHLFSRRHYVIFRPTDELNFRVGKFLRNYGLNDPNHNLYVRKELGFGFDTETYNLEASYLGETFSSSLTYLNGDLLKEPYTQLRDKGAAFNTSYNFLDSQKIGLSTYLGSNNNYKRWIFGPWWILSVGKKLFLLSEWDYQRLVNSESTQKQLGYVTSHKLGYEIHKGIIPFISFDRKALNHDDLTSQQNAYGVGLQAFPRPHIELIASWQRETIPYSKQESNLIWFLIHYYL